MIPTDDSSYSASMGYEIGKWNGTSLLNECVVVIQKVRPLATLSFYDSKIRRRLQSLSRDRRNSKHMRSSSK